MAQFNNKKINRERDVFKLKKEKNVIRGEIALVFFKTESP